MNLVINLWKVNLLFLLTIVYVLLQRHNSYAIRYWFCEALCLINIIVQLYFMNKFFDGEFMSYGLRVMTFSETVQEDRVDPMVYIFPRVTKCTFHKYGASGTIQKHDSLCILPLNIVNEKTYIFIWFWFIILLTMLSMLVVYRAIIISCPSIRPMLLRARNKMVPKEVAEAIARKTDVGDWWVLYMLGRNMDPLIYRDMITELAKKIETAASNSQ